MNPCDGIVILDRREVSVVAVTTWWMISVIKLTVGRRLTSLCRPKLTTRRDDRRAVAKF